MNDKMSVFETILTKAYKSTEWNTEKSISSPNRGIYFGDGLFETMVYQNDELRFFGFHLDRLMEGMKLLGLNESKISPSEIIEHCQAAFRDEPMRVRLTIFREGVGKYAPLSVGFSQILHLTKLEKAPKVKSKSIVSKTVRLSFNSFSHLKTTSALAYVMANKERQERKADEVILLDSFGNVAESGASNIFWLKKGIIYTPSLESGCIAGISRRVLMNELIGKGKEVSEGLYPLSELLQAELVWVSNVSGISMIETIENSEFDTDMPDFLKGIL
ncbi:aminotransferase class IV [Algoriphagus zhangzhouensis]|uniref:branched-chain-amino-acid transaminase n=1 Tax=Algoriphagus zhangzhouensis TaxID=1073327 RepID=A0A1M7Z6D7_9BACT|nr:aminotransferase class IV [Algoriphagus zhangzhouensis]TDY49103.1 branched-chain amino acid aminotransferase [Algoriphagus zhangzhouensis]SHO60435.1 branched-chain amino acid aminotransferase [Algoriphagus zhangzhouensis]